MNKISRAEAAAAGLKHFFTGRPCPAGHVGPYYVSCNRCVECMAVRRKKYRAENMDLIREKRRERDRKDRERVNARARNWREKNLEKAKAATRLWHEKNQDRQAAYRRETKEARNESNRRRRRERKASDPMFALQSTVRARVGTAFRRGGFPKLSKTALILGCTWEELKRHIERQFLKGMTWENRGTAWHVDHIRPLGEASSAEELIALCHFTNLRPLWAIENHKKHAKRLHLI